MLSGTNSGTNSQSSRARALFRSQPVKWGGSANENTIRNRNSSIAVECGTGTGDRQSVGGGAWALLDNNERKRLTEHPAGHDDRQDMANIYRGG